MKTTVSFPGLGIGEFTVDRVAFTIFGKDIYWYGVIITLGILAAFIHALIRAKQEGVKEDDLLDIGLFTVICGVIGARLYYVATTWDTHGYDSFVDVIAIWNGGLAIYGGIIGGGLAAVAVCLFKKLNPLKVTDMIAPGVMLAQAMGRWGNFFNGEAYGYEVAEDSLLYPFRMGLVSGYTSTGSEMHYYHPTFLYESLWNIVGFTLITVFYRKKKFNGQVTLAYFAWYGFGRMFIEGLRTDSLYVGSFRISQVVGCVCFVAGVALTVAGWVLSRKGKLDRWLTVRWAQPIPAEEEAVTEVSTAFDGTTDGDESAWTDDDAPAEPAADPLEDGSPVSPAPTEETEETDAQGDEPREESNTDTQ